MSAAVLAGKLPRALLAGALWAIGAGLAVAAETESAAGEAEAQGREAQAGTEGPIDDNAASSDELPQAHDVFLPTEEISEDFAVPFPVDI